MTSTRVRTAAGGAGLGGRFPGADLGAFAIRGARRPARRAVHGAPWAALGGAAPSAVLLARQRPAPDGNALQVGAARCG